MKAAKSFKTQEEINWPGKKSEKKENRTKKGLMDHFKVISILLLKNISSEITHANFVVNAMNDEVSSISPQLVEQIEVFLK